MYLLCTILKNLLHENIKIPCALDNINNNNTFEGMTTEDWTRFLNLPTDGSMSSVRKEREWGRETERGGRER